MKKFLTSLLLVAGVVSVAPVAVACTARYPAHVSQWYYYGHCAGMTPAQATSCAGNNRWYYHIGP
jgi:hypothetical protein